MAKEITQLFRLSERQAQRYGVKVVPLTTDVVNGAKKVCKLVKLKTVSRDIEDYPCKKGTLCKWGGEECEFYEICS